MSSYHSAFGYLGKKSDEDFGWIVSNLDDGDSGESDTYLSTDSIYSDSYDGTRRKTYGAKYNEVVRPQITVIKQDGTNFSLDDNRKALKWLTGSRQDSWLDLYIGDEIKYRILGRVQDVKQYKMDARIIGLIIIFESVSPWGYSAQQTISQSIIGSETITINNPSDDLYTYTHVNTIYENTSGESLTITNNTIGDVTTVEDLALNEIITLSDNMMITSDKPSRTFGESFNFVFPRLVSGDNELVIDGTGNITFEYISAVKIGDMAMDINMLNDDICDGDGNIQLDTLPWGRISDTPTTLGGYKISDAYTKAEVDTKIANIVDVQISWDQITHKPTTAEDYGLTDVYTKTDTDDLIANAVNGLQIDEQALNDMLAEVLV